MQINSEEKKSIKLNDEFPEAKLDIEKVMNGIAQSITEKDIEQLISYHAYSPKFTEFQNGQKRSGSKENEALEGSFFSSITGIYKWDTQDLKIDVFGDAVLVTFRTGFQPIIESDTLKITAQMGMRFVKTEENYS